MLADDVVIVGGGLSGLATAFYLGRAGIRSTIVEKAGRLGGLIQTDHLSGCDLEAGAESFISTKPAVAELARDLGGGLSDKIIGSNDAARRIFVIRHGQLTPMPKGMSMMVPTEWEPVLQSPLLSEPAKQRMLQEPSMKPRTRSGDFSVGELVSDHFGEELLESIAEPLLVGVYGGDPASLSARSVLPRFVAFEEQYGSLIEGVRRASVESPQQGSLFRTFRGGMQTLIDALANAIQSHTKVVQAEATGLERLADGWRLQMGSESLSCSRLVLACPAWAAATLLKNCAPDATAELAAIPYSSAILAMLVFNESQLARPLNGFGFLVPRREQYAIAAATWVNTKFLGRVAPGLAALRGFIVGKKALELANTPSEQIAEMVRADFERLMHVKGAPVFHTVYSWPRSMPQYVVGHAERIARIETAMKPHASICLTGNYFDGVGMPDSVRRAKQAAKQIEGGIV